MLSRTSSRRAPAPAPWCCCTWAGWVTSERPRACMHEMRFWFLKRNSSDEGCNAAAGMALTKGAEDYRGPNKIE